MDRRTGQVLLVILICLSEPGNNGIVFQPAHFINRELSWLEFNQRVLDEALDPKNPLLERVKFFCITSSNLDEFFEVRVAGLKQQIESDIVERSIDGLTATETFQAVTQRVRRMVERAIRLLARRACGPRWHENGIRILEIRELDRPDLRLARWNITAPRSGQC